MIHSFLLIGQSNMAGRGKRYFEVFQTLRDPHKVFVDKPHPDNAQRSAMETL